MVLVEMENKKGFRILPNNYGCNSEEIYFDMPVDVIFLDVSDEWPFPCLERRNKNGLYI
jgi:hypothetical protein